MAKRYASDPPCCPCLDKANEAVWSAPSSATHKWKYNYKPKKKIKADDWVARSYWMDAYKACIESRGLDPGKYITEDGHELPEGTLRARCSPPPKKETPLKVATLIVRVWDKRSKQRLPGAKVKLAYADDMLPT